MNHSRKNYQNGLMTIAPMWLYHSVLPLSITISLLNPIYIPVWLAQSPRYLQLFMKIRKSFEVWRYYEYNSRI